MCDKLGWVSLVTALLPVLLVGLYLLVLDKYTAVQAKSLTVSSATTDIKLDVDRASGPSTIVVQTWTHAYRADWEQGTLEWLDSATTPGTLQLAQRRFGNATTITPRKDLGAGQTAPAVAVDSEGNAYAVWSDGRRSSPW